MWGDFVRLFTHNVYSVRPKRGKQNFCASMAQKFFISLQTHSETDGAQAAWGLVAWAAGGPSGKPQPLGPRWVQRLVGGWVGHLSWLILSPFSLLSY